MLGWIVGGTGLAGFAAGALQVCKMFAPSQGHNPQVGDRIRIETAPGHSKQVVFLGYSGHGERAIQGGITGRPLYCTGSKRDAQQYAYLNSKGDRGRPMVALVVADRIPDTLMQRFENGEAPYHPESMQKCGAHVLTVEPVTEATDITLSACIGRAVRAFSASQ
ncbi:MAG: hypothetical protein RL235_806 [Chlamydiota bacterium]|jgi:hypothetical protein